MTWLLFKVQVDTRDVERRLDIATELIRSGVDVDAQDKNSETPLHFAARAFDPDQGIVEPTRKGGSVD